MEIVYDNILNPKKALKSIKESLFKLYQEDYGEEAFDEIQKRWDTTVFIMETTPEETYYFVMDNKKQIKNQSLMVRAHLEYVDFREQKRKIEKTLQEELRDYIQGRYNIYSDQFIQDLWSGKKDKNDASIKKEIEFKTSKIIRELYDARNIFLINNTLWGRRLLRKYKTLKPEQLAEIIFQEVFPAITCVVENKQKTTQTICFVPLIRHIKLPSLDRMFLHEARHVIETDGIRSGFVVFPDMTYNGINEVRTERNAIRDEKRTKTLFARQLAMRQSVYEEYIPKFNEFDGSMEYMNWVAFYGNLEEEKELLDRARDFLKQEQPKEKVMK